MLISESVHLQFSKWCAKLAFRKFPHHSTFLQSPQWPQNDRRRWRRPGRPAL